MSFRIGIGYDIHPLVEGRPLILGGVHIPHPKGLLGHSDSDALSHAISDALLGAAALGDLGTHFPDTDPHFKGASSTDLLAQVASMLRERGFQIENLDAVVVAQEPKLAPYIQTMRERIAQALGIGPDRISVKAKTSEGLESIGRGEAIAAHAVALLKRNGDQLDAPSHSAQRSLCDM
jgi:2-C-methyl-D-erythritol 2,4-cyclodiphosphate synthase